MDNHCQEHEQMIRDVAKAINKPNGFVRWHQFWLAMVGVITIAVTVTSIITGNLFGAIKEVRAEVKDNEKCFYSIDKRLQRIEDKLDVRK